MALGSGGMRLLVFVMMLAGLVGCATSPGSPDTNASEISRLGDEPVMLKTVQRAVYFTGQYEMPVNEIREQTRPLAQKVAVAAVKNAKLDIVGPLTLFLPDWRQPTFGDITLELGYPVTGSGQNLARYQKQMKDDFQCLTVTREAGSDSQDAWAELYRIAEENSLTATGDNRTVVSRNGSGYQIELQLGVRRK